MCLFPLDVCISKAFSFSRQNIEEPSEHRKKKSAFITYFTRKKWTLKGKSYFRREITEKEILQNKLKLRVLQTQKLMKQNLSSRSLRALLSSGDKSMKPLPSKSSCSLFLLLASASSCIFFEKRPELKNHFLGISLKFGTSWTACCISFEAAWWQWEEGQRLL